MVGNAEGELKRVFHNLYCSFRYSCQAGTAVSQVVQQ